MQRDKSRIMEILDYQGRSVTWFCERLGVDRSLLYRWNDGSRTPNDDHRRRAAEVLGVPEAYLFLPPELPEGSEILPIGDSEQQPAEPMAAATA